MSAVIDCVIIGAGPAGMEAAITASAFGVQVVLIDSAPKPGGQYFKQAPSQFQVEQNDPVHDKAKILFRKLAESSVTVYQNTLVWGIFESPIPGMWHLTLKGPDAPLRLDARTIILATGAYDSSIPFPGWDLPGVITAGAALTLVKNQHVLPGKKILLSGTGPLQLAAAATLHEGGADLFGVLESAQRLVPRGIRYLPAVWGQWARMKEGAGYIKSLVSGKIPYKVGWTVVEARGEDRVREAVIARLGRDGKIIADSRQTIAVDSIVLGFSLTPSTEFCRLLDCEMTYLKGRGGYVPRRNELLETSVPEVYAAGDCAGIGGAGMSMIEGRIAGAAVSNKLGKISDTVLQEQIRKDLALRAREEKFAQLLGDLFSPTDDLYRLAREDTIICRCEQITLKEVREAISFGAQSVGDVKSLTRSGMGNCQGRTCASIIAHILADETGRSVAESRYNSVRPPIHPLPMSVIEEYDLLFENDSMHPAGQHE